MRYARYFKFSVEMLEDPIAMKHLVAHQMSKQPSYLRGVVYKFLSIQEGQEADDFVRMLRTCIISYNTFKAPRIVPFRSPQKRRNGVHMLVKKSHRKQMKEWIRNNY